MKKKLNLMIVDDNPADFNLIKRMVESGLKVSKDLCITYCEDSQSCIETIQNQEFHCIILDYLLGGENGIVVLKSILKVTKRIPVIILTGEGDETVAVEAMKLGAADYLVKKDTNKNKIILAILNAIDKFELERKLRDKQRELEDFAYTAAHDIKAPLAIINQTSQLLALKATEIGEDEINSYSETFKEVSQNITNFITELLDYAKVGRSQRKLESVSLQKIIASSIENLQAVIDETQTLVEVEEKLPQINGDSFALIQFFQNIISNSIKFAKPNTRPSIKVFQMDLEEHESHYDHKICISDNGVGIAQEDQIKIFSPLVRLSQSSQTEGSGLGLAIAKKIIEQHKGEIWIESTFNKGTTVCILFYSNPNDHSHH